MPSSELQPHVTARMSVIAYTGLHVVKVQIIDNICWGIQKDASSRNQNQLLMDFRTAQSQRYALELPDMVILLQGHSIAFIGSGL